MSHTNASSQAEECKARGNAAFSAGNFQEAVDAFTTGIQAEPNNHILYSNRSAAFSSMGKWQEALDDAEMVISLKPSWPKGYSRKGAALHGKGLFAEAEEVLNQGLELDPSNEQLKSALSQCREEQQKESKEFSNPFSSPDAIAKIAANPKTAHLLSDPSFLQKMQILKADPQKLGSMLQDPQIMQAFGALLGVDFSTFSPPEPKEEAREEEKKEPKKETSSQPSLKEQGNAKYKAKEFSQALDLYAQALESASRAEQVSINLNISAVYFEEQRFQECISKCEEVVEQARACSADFSLVAKALSRVGNCWLKLGDLEKAVEFFKRSITEHRNPQIVSLLNKCEKDLALQKKEAYRNPALSEEQRNKGNELFKKGNWVEALACYNEAVKRNDKDPKNYSNRAATYIKLAAFPEALKDCDFAIELDPTFVKPYIRKASILHLKKDYSKCIEVCQEGMKHDPANDELRTQIYNAHQEMNKQSGGGGGAGQVNDPEVQSILMDPVMRSILEQAQQDPKALMEHMKNPVVAGKIQKLINAGIIKTR